MARLAADGYRVDYDTIQNATPDGNINRALIAKALLAGGYVPSVKAAFDTLLGEGMGYYIPPERLDLFDAIRFLKSIHAVPVWAHPLQYIDEATVRVELRDALENSVDCIPEVIMKDCHTIGKNPNNAVRWVEIAREEIDRVSGL